MIVRSVAALALGAFAIATPASASPAQVPPVPQPAHYAQRSAGAVFETGTHSAWVWASEFGSSAEGCIELIDHVSGRYESGCGPLELSIDPALTSATIRGAVPSFVYGGRRNHRSSRLTVEVALEGAGIHQLGIGQGSWIAPPFVDAGAGASVWREAVGTGRVDSSALCSGDDSRSRRGRSRRTDGRCSPSTGVLPVDAGGMSAGASVWIGTGGGECGDSIRAAAC